MISRVHPRFPAGSVHLLHNRECSLPAVPSIVSEPLSLGQVPIPSRFFLAPLAGYTSLAYRLAVRECGGLGLATTDLVNARSLIEKHRRAFELSETCESDRPLSIQIYGHVTSEMEQAARWVEEKGAAAVDINMGCPVRKVVRTGGGSALMCQMDRAVDLVAAVVNAVSIPVTVKMRLGWDDESLTAPDAGACFRAGRRSGGDRPRPNPSARVQGSCEPRGHSRRGRGRRSHTGRRQRRYPNDRRCRGDVRGNRLRGGLDRPGVAGQSLSFSPARLLEPDRATRAPIRRSKNGST